MSRRDDKWPYKIHRSRQNCSARLIVCFVCFHKWHLNFLECEHLVLAFKTFWSCNWKVQSASVLQWKTLVLPSYKVSHWPFTTPSEKKSVISWVIFVIEHIISVKVFSFDQPSKSHIKHQCLLKGAVHRQSCSQGLVHSFNIWSDILILAHVRSIFWVFALKGLTSPFNKYKLFPSNSRIVSDKTEKDSYMVCRMVY